MTLTDGSYHTVDSSDAAFQAAAKLALAEALPKAKPVLLEPVLVRRDRDSDRGLVQGDRPRHGAARADPRLRQRPGWTGWDVISATIPEAEIGDLIVELRSATAGVGTFYHAFRPSGRTERQAWRKWCSTSRIRAGIGRF